MQGGAAKNPRTLKRCDRRVFPFFFPLSHCPAVRRIATELEKLQKVGTAAGRGEKRWSHLFFCEGGWSKWTNACDGRSCLWQEPLAWAKVELKDKSELLVWKVLLSGPEKSPYDKGVFELEVDLRQEYPFKHPQVSSFLSVLFLLTSCAGYVCHTFCHAL